MRIAQAIQPSSSAADAAALVAQLQTLTDLIAAGVDRDGNGEIGWQQGEGGVAAVEQQVWPLRTAEAL